MDRLIAQRRFYMVLLAVFGMLGLVISAVGLYGVMAYLVAQRTSEIGVRMALGATPGAVVALVLAARGRLMAIGLAIGTGAAWYVSAAVKRFLFQVEPTDPRVFAGAIRCWRSRASPPVRCRRDARPRWTRLPRSGASNSGRGILCAEQADDRRARGCAT